MPIITSTRTRPAHSLRSLAVQAARERDAAERAQEDDERRIAAERRELHERAAVAAVAALAGCPADWLTATADESGCDVIVAAADVRLSVAWFAGHFMGIRLLAECWRPDCRGDVPIPVRSLAAIGDALGAAHECPAHAGHAAHTVAR
jgi:hypothetical protein